MSVAAIVALVIAGLFVMWFVTGYNALVKARNLYKNVPGTRLVFEEVNETLGMTYRYAWTSGEPTMDRIVPRTTAA